MSNLRNSVQLIGHLGANPEVKNFDNGKKIVKMRIATRESYQINGEWKEETQWHHLVAWDSIADRAVGQLQKGDFLLIEGKLTHRSYENNKGEKGYITEVRIQNFISLEPKQPSDPNHSASNLERINEPENTDQPF